MEKDKGFSERYKESITHLLDNDFARKLQDTNRKSKSLLLPHFGVENPQNAAFSIALIKQLACVLTITYLLC